MTAGKGTEQDGAVQGSPDVLDLDRLEPRCWTSGTFGRVLWLVRHAKSSWNSDAATDHARPLARRGRRDSATLGAWLARQEPGPEMVLCSTARRARDTLAGAREGWVAGGPAVVYLDSLYHASAAALLDEVRQVPEPVRSVVMVGHNPGLDDLLRTLFGTDLPHTPKGKLMTTANVAVIGVAGGWRECSAGNTALLAIARPKRGS